MAKKKKAENAEVAAIRARWRQRLTEIEPTQFAVFPAELSAVLVDHTPPGFEPFKEQLARESPPPTHLLLTPAQLQTLAADDSEQQQPDSPADVPGEGSDVDDQSDARAN